MVNQDDFLFVGPDQVFTFSEDYIKLQRLSVKNIKSIFPFFDSSQLNKAEKEEIKNFSNPQLDLLDLNGFLDDKRSVVDIEYRTNKFNLRGPDIDITKPTDIYLGCSDTYGISQFEEKTWPHLVSTSIGTQYLNCGFPGGSMDNCYLVLKVISNYVKINRVFLLSPSPYRGQIYYRASDAVRMMQIGPNFHKVYTKSKEMSQFAELVFQKVYSCEESIMVNFEKNLDGIKHIVSQNKAKLYHTFNPSLPLSGIEIDIETNSKDRARDLRHYGEQFQKQIADFFVKKVNQHSL